MKCSIKNLRKVVDYIENMHLDNIGNGGDFALFDDESNLLSAVEQTVEMFKEEANK